MLRFLSCVGILLVAGCATDQPRYVRDGVVYGRTEGSFRGRWWNYYERGRSFQDGGFHEEARTDFEKALGERDREQRWARTYGLHFVPQYFPNRESGIAAFYLNNYSEAVEQLERSHEQLPSARAADYLRRALKAQAEPNADTLAPKVDIADPDLYVRNTNLEVTVLAEDDGYVDSIAINGEPVLIGAPAKTVETEAVANLQPGINEIVVSVTDIAGNTRETTFGVVSDLDGPVVSFNDPGDSGATLSGVVADDAGLASLRINGAPVALQTSASGESSFTFGPTGDTSLEFQAEDTLGNRTSGTVEVDSYRMSRREDSVRFATLVSERHRVGRVLLLQPPARLAQTPSLPVVRLANLSDGQRYLGDEIVVDIEIDAPQGVSDLSLNGTPLSVFADRQVQRVSRRVRLPKAGRNVITAVLRDRAGRETTKSVTVERVLTEIEAVNRKLSLAVLGNIWEGPNRDIVVEEQFIADELTRLLFARGRFDLVSRDVLPQVLTEQELQAALGDRSGSSPLRGIVPAELMAIGMVRKDLESVEIILQAISLETSQLMGYADVSGLVQSRDDLRRLTETLAIRFLQEFPRVQGRIVDVRRATRALASLSLADRIRPDLKCIVFREGAELRDPATGISLGTPTEVLAEGTFADVRDRFSSIDFDSDALPTTTDIEVEDLVITK